MNISPINYQPNIKTNNSLTFQSKATLTKSMEQTGKRTLTMMAGSLLAYLGLHF